MFEQDCALLVHDLPQPFGMLEALLKDFPVAVWSIRSDGDALDLMARHNPALIFVDLPIWNRSSSSIIGLAWSADPAANVIVVGSRQDIEVYVATIERGAFNFVAPPFSREGLRSMVNHAFADVRARNEALSRSLFGNPNPGPSLPLDLPRGLQHYSYSWGRPFTVETGKKYA